MAAPVPAAATTDATATATAAATATATAAAVHFFYGGGLTVAQFTQMRASGLRPTQHTYTKAVRTFWFNQLTDLAAETTEEMVAAGFVLDEKFYSVQITAVRDVGTGAPHSLAHTDPRPRPPPPTPRKVCKPLILWSLRAPVTSALVRG